MYYLLTWVWQAIAALIQNPDATFVGLLTTTALLMFAGRVPAVYNVMNLLVRWKTTAMTALAFTLVTAILVVMLAFVNGMTALTKNSGVPGNVIIFSEGSTDEAFSNFGYSDIGDIENQPEIQRTGDRPLLSKETFLTVNQPIENPQPKRPKRRFLQVRGIQDPEVAATVHRQELLPGGEWFSEAGVRELPGANGEPESVVEVVLGEGIAREMGADRSLEQRAKAKNPQRLDVGDSFPLNNRKWHVVGVMKSAGVTFDSEVWAKQSLIGPLFGKNNYTTLVAKTLNDDTALALKNYLNNDFGKARLAAQLETDYFNNLTQTNSQFLYAIQFVTAVMSLGGVFGVMNTMFAAVSQRIKDVGVLRLLGFPPWQVLSSFLVESMLIALVGGMAGCLIGGMADGWTANSIVSSGPGGGGKFVVLKLVVDWPIYYSGLALALATGFIGGLIPSLSAMRLSALEALR